MKASSPPAAGQDRPESRPGVKRPAKNSGTSQSGASTRAGAFITRANNPLRLSEQRKKSKKQEIQGGESSESPPPKESQIPDYLVFLITIFYHYPVQILQKICAVISYVVNLPARIYSALLYYCVTLPLNCFENLQTFAAEFPGKFVTWASNNIQGLLSFCAQYHLGGVALIRLILWFCPIWPNNMTYPLFAILRLVSFTLYPAYASYKALRTKTFVGSQALINT